MANIFTPEQKESIQRSLDTTLSVFQDRFDEKQYEDFKQNEYAEYLAGQQEVLNLVLTSDDPDKGDLSEAFKKYQENQNRLFDYASKYQKNKRIADLAQRHLDHDKNMFETMMTAEEKAHALSRRGLVEGQETRAAEASIRSAESLAASREAETKTQQELLPLKIESERALAEKRTAEAERARRETPEKERYFGYLTDMVAPEVLQEWAGTDTGLQQARQLIEANLSRRDGPMGKALAQEASEVTKSMAKAYIDRAKARGEKRSPSDDWDYSPESISAAAILIDQGEVRKEHLKRRLLSEGQRLGFDQQEIAERFPDIYDTVIKRPGFSPLTGTVNYGELTTRLFGKNPGELANALRLENPADVLNPDKLIKRIKESKTLNLGELGAVDSPVVHALAVAQASGGFDPNNPDKKFESYSEFVNFLNKTGDEHIVIEIGGADLSDKELPRATQEARKNARRIQNAIIEKFAPSLARELNIKGAPPEKKSDWSILGSQTVTGGLLRKAKKRVFGEE